MPAILALTVVQVSPASSETTVAPKLPAAIARVGEAKLTAKILSVDGVTDEKLSPPSAVRNRRSPVSVVIRQVAAVAHLIEVSARLPPVDFTVHVSPPSTVRRTDDPAPTA